MVLLRVTQQVHSRVGLEPFSVQEFGLWCQMSNGCSRGLEEPSWACRGQPGKLTVSVQACPQQAPGCLPSPACIDPSEGRPSGHSYGRGRVSLAPWQAWVSSSLTVPSLLCGLGHVPGLSV